MTTPCPDSWSGSLAMFTSPQTVQCQRKLPEAGPLHLQSRNSGMVSPTSPRVASLRKLVGILCTLAMALHLSPMWRRLHASRVTICSQPISAQGYAPGWNFTPTWSLGHLSQTGYAITPSNWVLVQVSFRRAASPFSDEFRIADKANRCKVTEVGFNALTTRENNSLASTEKLTVKNRPAGTNNLFVAWETLTNAENPK